MKKYIATLTMLTVFMVPGLSQAKDVHLKESARCSEYIKYYENYYHMPKNLLKAISITESGRYHKKTTNAIPWPWTINVKGKGYYFKSKADAVKAVKRLKKAGIESIDVGCMQINLRYHPTAFKNIEEALEPKYNIRYASSFLYKDYKKTNNWQKSIGRYHNKKPSQGGRYVKRVYTNWKRLDENFTVSSLDVKTVPVLRVKPKHYSPPDPILEVAQRSLIIFGN